ncbi:unnamed protein product [Triticum turgidum subsp. durum]|uniref:Chorein N-terminal domain-containing protein n=1 Tax=Triticum turgidum subsp. durum TaxID=4567 RepID=A0A9R1AZQ1_TRITD|nr:unnamed protein product [Triticum turgidum subsp. durum]
MEGDLVGAWVGEKRGESLSLKEEWVNEFRVVGRCAVGAELWGFRVGLDGLHVVSLVIGTEFAVLFLLRKYLGEYVEGLSVEALRISVWKGDVVLKDLKLKAEALNSLQLPVTVKAGFVGTITLKVPWKSLGKEPVIVLIDRLFILAHPAPDGQTLKEEDREKLFEAKLQQIEFHVYVTFDFIPFNKTVMLPRKKCHNEHPSVVVEQENQN